MKPHDITIQIHINGRWNDAARLTLIKPDAGWRGATKLRYEDAYVFETDPDFTSEVRGLAALTVRFPPSLETRSYTHWPPFLLDLLPQGHARKVLAKALGLNQDSHSCDTPLLLRAGGSPIGNLRIKQARDAERKRLKGKTHPGLTLEQVFARDDVFTEFARDFSALAAGSSGVQGAWPKLLLTRNRGKRWLPDPMVPDGEATDHVIIKWAGDRHEATRLILGSEAPYLELARAFGLRCARKLEYRDGTLLIPRFDRQVAEGKVIRFGQESIVSAAGVAGFGHQAAHEDYLDVIKTLCDDPAAEVTEYVLRDVLNLALGNPDNHGRNTALQKAPDGSVRLTPVYDFCPMRLEPSGIARSTTWRCMRPVNGPSRDLNPDWEEVCRVAAQGVMEPEALIDALAGQAENLRRMPELAQGLRISDAVIERSMALCEAQVQALDALGRRRADGPR
jgi:serine/threonine-protein kinase HipA